MLTGILTAAALLAFIGVVLWAYSGRRRADFERAAQMPLDEDQGRER